MYRKIEILEFETLRDALDYECGAQAGYYCSPDCPMIASTGCALTLPKREAETILLKQAGWEKTWEPGQRVAVINVDGCESDLLTDADYRAEKVGIAAVSKAVEISSKTGADMVKMLEDAREYIGGYVELLYTMVADREEKQND